ncbi:MAG: hypothetical protein AB1576_05305 [Bacillota bacterium]
MKASIAASRLFEELLEVVGEENRAAREDLEHLEVVVSRREEAFLRLQAYLEAGGPLEEKDWAALKVIRQIDNDTHELIGQAMKGVHKELHNLRSAKGYLNYQSARATCIDEQG